MHAVQIVADGVGADVEIAGGGFLGRTDRRPGEQGLMLSGGECARATQGSVCSPRWKRFDPSCTVASQRALERIFLATSAFCTAT